MHDLVPLQEAANENTVPRRESAQFWIALVLAVAAVIAATIAAWPKMFAPLAGS